MSEVKRLSDYLPPTPEPISLRDHDELLDRDIVISGVELREGEQGPFLVIEASVDGEAVVITTGAELVVKRLTDPRIEFPVIVSFRKSGRWYTVD